MATRIILENDYAILRFHEETRIVHHTFHKPVGDENFRSVLVKGVETLKEYGACKWLADDRLNDTLSNADTDWAINTWFPEAQAAGWKYWALVVPDDYTARLSLKAHVDTYYERGIAVKAFTSLDIAREWLEQVEE